MLSIRCNLAASARTSLADRPTEQRDRPCARNHPNLALCVFRQRPADFLGLGRAELKTLMFVAAIPDQVGQEHLTVIIAQPCIIGHPSAVDLLSSAKCALSCA